MKKNPVLTFIFACLPGAGQMYYGYMQRGLSLITLFCLCFTVGMIAGPLVIFSGIIWMYSFFDTYDLIRYIVAGDPKPDKLLIVEDWDTIKRIFPKTNKLLGWGLIAIGLFLLYDNILRPLFIGLLRYFGVENAWYYLDLIPPIVIGIIFIAAGLWLLGMRPPHKAPELPPYPTEGTKE